MRKYVLSFLRLFKVYRELEMKYWEAQVHIDQLEAERHARA